jgi:hypothetical protein
VRCQGCGVTLKSGGELAVVGNLRNVGSSVVQSNVKLWLCETIIFTYVVKSKGRIAPFVPVLKVVQVGSRQIDRLPLPSVK